MKKIRILIADDHALLRVGLRTMLDTQPDMTVVGEAGNGRDAVARAIELGPDVVVMDLMMPKLDGAEATRQIVEALPETKVIILTSYGTSADLAKRQREVLLGVANGRTSDQIADDLGISVSAVKQHIAAVCEKLNASSRSEAVTIAIRRNLLKL